MVGQKRKKINTPRNIKSKIKKNTTETVIKSTLKSNSLMSVIETSPASANTNKANNFKELNTTKYFKHNTKKLERCKEWIESQKSISKYIINEDDNDLDNSTNSNHDPDVKKNKEKNVSNCFKDIIHFYLTYFNLINNLFIYICRNHLEEVVFQLRKQENI